MFIIIATNFRKSLFFKELSYQNTKSQPNKGWLKINLTAIYLSAMPEVWVRRNASGSLLAPDHV
jgi:hypothetical protein